MDKDQIELLEEFVDFCQIKPSILQLDELKFFRDWLSSLGAKIPHETSINDETRMYEELSDLHETKESGISMEGVIETDVIFDEQFMGDEMLDITEEMQDLADNKKNEALEKIKEGDYREAIGLLTEAIKLNPTYAMIFAKRANCYIKLQYPNAAIKDCNKSLELNPDSALTYKYRGLGYKLLGKWEQAFDDLAVSLKLDYSDDTYEQMKEVEPKAKEIREQKRKLERKKEENMNERREQIRRDKIEQQTVKECWDARCGDTGCSATCDGEMPCDFSDLLNDPELVEDMKDPEVMKMLTEIMSNPTAIMNYHSNQKIAKIIKNMQRQIDCVYPMDYSKLTKNKPADQITDDLD